MSDLLHCGITALSSVTPFSRTRTQRTQLAAATCPSQHSCTSLLCGCNRYNAHQQHMPGPAAHKLPHMLPVSLWRQITDNVQHASHAGATVAAKACTACHPTYSYRGGSDCEHCIPRHNRTHQRLQAMANKNNNPQYTTNTCKAYNRPTTRIEYLKSASYTRPTLHLHKCNREHASHAQHMHALRQVSVHA
jgi:hypothetical protein